MTIPRKLSLVINGNETLIASKPVAELSKNFEKPAVITNLAVPDKVNPGEKLSSIPCRINLTFEDSKDFSIILSNDLNEEVVVGYRKSKTNV